jgi:hypothetical protein
MKTTHDYGSYRIPAPEVTDPRQALEDAAGEMDTTRQLHATLMGDIEGLQETAEALKSRPGTIAPDAVISRLRALWALAEATDARLKDHHILLHAIIDQQVVEEGESAGIRSPVGRHVDQHRKRAWDTALAAFQAANTRVAEAQGDEATNAAVLGSGGQHERLGMLVRTRVPDLDALREKVRIRRAETGEGEYAMLSQLMADIDHLN